MSGDNATSRSILSSFIRLMTLVTPGDLYINQVNSNFATKVLLKDTPMGSNLFNTPTFAARSNTWFASVKEKRTSQVHLSVGDEAGM